MKKLNSTSLALAVALMAILASTQGAFGVETPLTDYSRAVMLENPVYYWNFNEAGATDVAQEVMRYETEAQMLPVIDATRVSGFSMVLGKAASFNDNAAFWAEMINRGTGTGAYAIEYWVKAGIGRGYIANFLGTESNGDIPSILHGYTLNQTELSYGGSARTYAKPELNFSDGGWHHVVLAVNCDANLGTVDQIDIAVDGVVTTNLASISTRQLDITSAINLGACYPNTIDEQYDPVPGPEATAVLDGFIGEIDEFAVYDLSGMDATAVEAKITSLAGHYDLATAPVEIAPFAAVTADEVTYFRIGGKPIDATYGDTDGSELSDATYAGSLSLDNMVGFTGTETYVELQFDLGALKTLDAIWIDYAGAGGKEDINAPVSVELSYSTDGTSFSTLPMTETPEFNDVTDGGLTYYNERRVQVDVDEVEVQYVRVKLHGSDTSIFLSEIQFMEVIPDKIPGDANNDGQVDGSDVTILANNWQAGVGDPNPVYITWSMGDFNGDGKVDGSDVTILANNWQTGVSAAAAAVPEPGTIILLLSAVTSLLIWRRVRK